MNMSCTWIGMMTVMILSGIACAAEIPATSVRHTLATYYTKDRNEVFTLVTDYEYLNKKVTIDEEETRISDLRLYVTRISIPGTTNWKPLDLPFLKKWDFRGIASTPLWTKGYVLSADYILPTGEFFNSASSGLCCLIFDGSFRLFQFDAVKGVFTEKKPTEELTAELRKWYGSSFKVDDVYWSYGLVKHAEFFGKKSIDLNEIVKHPPLHTIDELFSAWRRIAE